MTQEQIEQKEKEMRKENPEMFTHPDLQPGEVWLGDHLCDIVPIHVDTYKENGMPSARRGDKPVEGKLKRTKGTFDFYPIFVNLQELIVAEDEYKQKKAQKV